MFKCLIIPNEVHIKSSRWQEIEKWKEKNMPNHTCIYTTDMLNGSLIYSVSMDLLFDCHNKLHEHFNKSKWGLNVRVEHILFFEILHVKLIVDL